MSSPTTRRSSGRGFTTGRALRRPGALRPVVERVERRVLLSTYVVTNTSDAGPGSLRQAMLDANASVGLDEIHFNIPGAGAQSISPQSPLPAFSGPVILDATTQPGYAGSPLVELNGSSAGATADGLHVYHTSTIRGLVVNRFGGSGIVLRAIDNVVRGNYVGTDAAGSAAPGFGNGGHGVHAASRANTVGGTAPGAGNVISGNGGAGVLVRDPAGGLIVEVRVEGNLIGTDAAGTAALGNAGHGVLIEAGFINMVGGSTAAAGNVIAHNAGDGVCVVVGNQPAQSTSNRITGNSIFANGGLGIDLGDDGPTHNDPPGDLDTGPNGLLNFPTILGAGTDASGTNVVLEYSGPHNPAVVLEFYASPPGTADASGFGEGRTLIGTYSRIYNTVGTVYAFVTLPAVPVGSVITCTATGGNLSGPSHQGGTSEFSRAVVAGPFSALPAPSIPDLAASHDTGASNSDNITSRPSFPVTGTAPAGSTVYLVIDGATSDNGIVSGRAVAADGTYSFQAATQVFNGTIPVRVVATDSAGRASAAATLRVTVDQQYPRAYASPERGFSASGNVLRFRFDEDLVGTFTAADLAVRAESGADVPATRAEYDPTTRVVTFHFAAALPNGNYRATVSSATVTDLAGNPVVTRSLNFFALAGDINRDRRVDSSDFVTLAGNFGKTGMTFDQGDLNGDGRVDSRDFVILAGNFGKTVAAPTAVVAAPAAQSPVGRRNTTEPVRPAPGARSIRPHRKPIARRLPKV